MIQIFVEEEKVIGVYNGDNLRDGWIVVDNIPEPDCKEGYDFIRYYRNGKIEYEYFEVPANEDSASVNYEDLVNTLIRKRYSLSQELAILRQKDVKVAEYKEYYAYCEECKNKAKNELGLY